MKKLAILSIITIVFVSGCIAIQMPDGGPSEQKFIPLSIENNCIGFVTGNPDEEINVMAKIGVGWARPHMGPFSWGWMEPHKGNFRFEGADRWVREAQKHNIAILGTIFPYADWDQQICHGSECEVSPEEESYPIREGPIVMGIPKSRCKPCNFNDYKDFVSKLVERYDGDGYDDMPGLEIPIKYWEVLNEPEMAEVRLTFFIGTEEEYVEILKASYEAIKGSCSDCKVVQGGASNAMPAELEYWEKVFDLGGADYFDIANIHYITEGDLSTLNVKDFKALLEEKNINKPIWVTEAQYSSEDQIESSVDGALTAGASKIFFTQFKVGQFGVPPSGEYSKVYEDIVKRCK